MTNTNILIQDNFKNTENKSIKIRKMFGQANFHRTFNLILWHPFTSSMNYFHKIN